MNNKLSYILMIVFLMFQNSKIQAQDTGANCKVKLQKAIELLTKNNYTKQDSIKAIKLLKPCAKKGSSNAQLLLGRLYLQSKKVKYHRKGFKLMKKSAKQNQATSMYELATLYKYGKGCRLNYNKALKWYRKSAKLGNEKAIYSMGYMYYKGLGTINQNYTKALQWFQKSNDPMAYYWLGICYHYGYGVPQDLNKSLSYFKKDTIINHSFNNQNISNLSTVSNQNSNDTLQNSNTNNLPFVVNENFTPKELSGKWKGRLFLLDWSTTNTEQSIPISLDIKYNPSDETFTNSWTINNLTYTDNAIYNQKTMYNNELYITLPTHSFSDKIEKELDYQILSCAFELKTLNNNTYLTALVESSIDNWQEPGSPIRLVLARENVLSDNNEVISEEIVQALSNQENSFIKLYPNPFVTDLIIAYTLEKESYVQVKITNFTTSTSTVLEQGKIQKKGNHRYFFDGISVEKGMYIISIVVDGVQKTKLILKK